MSGKKVIAGIVFVGALFAFCFWGAKYALAPRADICQICGRAVHEGQRYTIRLKDGTSEDACCPRCGMHYELHHPQDIGGAMATDYQEHQRIPAEQAFFVETTAVSVCDAEPLRREEPALAELHWDRCFPTLLAFRTREEAIGFQRAKGGTVLTYAESLERVRKR